MTDLLDPELLYAVDALTGQTFNGEVWRVTWSSRNPLIGNASGGRWSPDNRFEALYTSLSNDGALSEAYYHLSRAPIMSSSDMQLSHLKVNLDNVLVLNEKQLIQLGVEKPFASRFENNRSQAIGEVAYMLDYQALIVPSARWDCNNLMLFIDRIDLNEHIEVLETNKVNWPAWREKIDRGQ